MKHSVNTGRPHGRGGWRLGWLLLLLLGAGCLAAQAQPVATPFSVRVTPASNIVLPPGGSQVLTAEATYTAFASGVGFDGPVYAQVSQPDGKVLAGGAFSTCNGTARARLARLNADGSLDASFTLAGTGFDGAVKALARQADGKVLVGGEFTHYGSVARNYLLRLNADGSLDASFAPGAGPDAPVAALVVQPDGKIFIGGSFKAYAGVGRDGLARVLPSGVLDPSFQTSYSASSPVLCLALQADGRLLVGGSLSSYSPTGTTTARNYLARFDASGTLDAAFVPAQVNNILRSRTTSVNALVVQPDGKIVLGGSVYYVAAQSRSSLVQRLNADGTREVERSGTLFSSDVTALALQADGKILAGENVRTSLDQRADLLRLNADGTQDAVLATCDGASPQIYSIAVQPNGQRWLGGNFTRCNNVVAGYFARFNADGTFVDALKNVSGSASEATYQWSTGATGPTLTVTAPGIYYATATLSGLTVTSNSVAVSGGTYRLRAGGEALTTNRGQFMADGYYSASSRGGGTAASIAGTLDPALFQSERYSTNGTLSYALPVVNGTYQLVLYFAEIYWNKPGQRVFNISLEGQTRLTNYDIVKEVGPRVATSKIFTVTVTDGVLNVDLRVPYERGGADQAKLSALEVLPTPPPLSPSNQPPFASTGQDQRLTLPAGASTTSTVLDGYGGDLDGSGGNYGAASLRWSQVSGPTVASFSSLTEATPLVGNLAAGTYVFGLVAYDNFGAASSRATVTITVNPSPYTAVLRVNTGGPAVQTTRGDFAADKYSDALGARGGTSAAISGTPDPALYQTERYSTNGALHFAFDVGNGTYQVVLHFAELYWTQPGQRVFDVSLEGSKVLSKYDIVQRVGPLAADVQSFAVSVTDGVLNLDLVVPYNEGGADQAKISAFEILRAPAASPSASTSSSEQALSAAAASPLGAGRVYPNPARAGSCTLACSASQGQAATLTLTDALGRQVRQQAVQLQAGANELAVDAASLAPGLYQLSLTTASGQHQSHKLLVQP